MSSLENSVMEILGGINQKEAVERATMNAIEPTRG